MIIFPMAGLSQRFFRAGYDLPKYMLDLAGRPMFDYTIASFSEILNKQTLLFVCRSSFETPEFIRSRLSLLGVDRYECVVLNAETAGQAETVMLGLKLAQVRNSEPVTVFNIDTLRLNLPDYSANTTAGCLEVFKGEGDNWSFVEPSGLSNIVVRTTEKEPISNLCSSGLYHFSSAEIFRAAYEDELNNRSTNQAEYYVAPIYNHMIRAGLTVIYNEVPYEDIIFCGVPQEYQSLIRNPALVAPLIRVLDSISVRGR